MWCASPFRAPRGPGKSSALLTTTCHSAPPCLVPRPSGPSPEAPPWPKRCSSHTTKNMALSASWSCALSHGTLPASLQVQQGPGVYPGLRDAVSTPPGHRQDPAPLLLLAFFTHLLSPLILLLYVVTSRPMKLKLPIFNQLMFVTHLPALWQCSCHQIRGQIKRDMAAKFCLFIGKEVKGHISQHFCQPSAYIRTSVSYKYA